MPDLLVRGGRPWGHDGPADVLVRDGVIDRVEPDIGRAVTPDVEVLDVPGRLVLPGLVEAHCHLDKTLYGGPWVPHSAGDAVADRIADERRRRGELGIPDVDRITALLERMVTAGTSYVRSHTDVDPETGLRGVEAVRTASERLAGRIDVQQVAFPQSGLLTNPGTAELLEEALQSGVGRSAVSTRPASTATRCGILTSSSASPSATAPGWTSTCTIQARWAPGSWS